MPKPTYAVEGVAFHAYSANTDAPNLVPVYRFYDVDSNRHFWTTAKDGEHLDIKKFRPEGPAFYTPAAPAGNIPVYRFHDGIHHFWTTDHNGELLPKPGFKLEGTAFYAPASPGSATKPVWRFHASQDLMPGHIIQEGAGYKEIIIGAGWQWIDTYVNLNINAVVWGQKARTYEVASGFVFPWNDVGPK